jgi:hypothetical protein
VLAFNRTAAPLTMSIDLRTLRGVPDARSYTVKDLWEHTSRHARRLQLRVASHGVRMLKACPR